jgi:uncharacterized protein
VVLTSPVRPAPRGGFLAPLALLLVRRAPLVRRASPLLAALVALALWLTTSLAGAFTPPEPVGHVNDLTHRLSAADQAYLEDKLTRYERGTTNQIAVLVLDSLEGEPIEDVAFTTFRAWKIGQKGKDNGVLLLLATGDRRTRIETGKGVGGELTDLQTNDILKQRVGPRLKVNDLRGAIDGGTDGIIQALGGNSAAPRTPGSARPVGRQKATPGAVCLWAVLILLVFILLMYLGRRGGGGGGGGGFIFLPGGGGGGGGGGDDGGFSGGGGESGGGGSSDSY